jgi:hypothetical protein
MMTPPWTLPTTFASSCVIGRTNVISLADTGLASRATPS